LLAETAPCSLGLTYEATFERARRAITGPDWAASRSRRVAAARVC